MIPAFEDLCSEQGIRGLVAIHSETAPLLGFVSHGQYSLKADSPEFNSDVVKIAVERHVPIVMIAALWTNYSRDSAFAPCLAKTVRSLTAAGVGVVIIRDVALQNGDVPWLLARASLWGQNVDKIGVPLELHRQRNLEADRVFASLAGQHVTVLDPAPYFVDATGLWRAEYGRRAMYSDESHLSFEGALRLRPMFAPWVGGSEARSSPDGPATTTRLGAHPNIRSSASTES